MSKIEQNINQESRISSTPNNSSYDNEYTNTILIENTPSATENSVNNSLKVEYENFLKKNIINARQNELLYRVISFLTNIEASVEIFLETSIEEEIVISKRDLNGVSIFVIDNEGDGLINFTSYSGEAWTHHYDFHEFDEELFVYRFLS